jgi:hypothetical protein
MIQKVLPGKWAALEEIDKKFNAVESRLGFPSKKRYRCMIGGHDTNTLVVERQWDSLAKMEAAHEKAFLDPEHQALAEEINSLIVSNQYEVYIPLP